MTDSMNTAILCLGSNTEDRDIILRDAVAALTEFAEAVSCSEVYDGPSHNGIGRDYLNTVVVVRTTKEISEVDAIGKELETRAGRTPESKTTGVMPLDIDLVVWNDQVLRPYDFSRPHFTRGLIQLL